MSSGSNIRTAATGSEALRRAADIVIGASMLVILSPALLIIGIVIRLTSRGPALFRQTRAGLDGRPFTLWKYRTMRVDADPYGSSPHSGRDPRLTSFGRFVRETSLDELPQFWNVLRGDMTLVGPRPLYVSQAAEWSERQRLRLSVKPGLTGLSQVSGRGELTIEDKLELDVQYVERRSLRLDLWIVWRTFMRLFRPRHIYEKHYSRDEEFRGKKGD